MVVCTDAPGVDVLHLRPTPPTILIIDDEALWVFGSDEYSNLAKNFLDIKALVEQIQAQRDHYLGCVNIYRDAYGKEEKAVD